jgi:hypothetical protein
MIHHDKDTVSGIPLEEYLKIFLCVLEIVTFPGIVHSTCSCSVNSLNKLFSEFTEQLHVQCTYSPF